MKKALAWTLFAAVLAFVASCASTPDKPKESSPAGQEPAAGAPDAELAKAKELQQTVDTYRLGTYAPDDYAAAKSSLKSGQETYGTDNAASKLALDKSIASFNAVIEKGGPALIGEARKKSAAARKTADDLKASVALKDEYAQAKEVYDRAEKESAAGDFISGFKDYARAGDMFASVAAAAKDKRDKAKQALNQTNQAMTVSEKNAAAAQQSLQAEGFTAQGGSQ